MQLWLKYFAERHEVVLFSDKEDYLKRQEFGGNVKVIEVYGYLGRLIGAFNLKSFAVAHLDKLISSLMFSKIISMVIDENCIDVVHAHSLYYGYLSSRIRDDIPVIFTPMGSDVIIHAQHRKIHKYMARQAFARADVVTGDSLLLRGQGYKVGATPEHNYIIQNGVDTKIFYPKNNELKRELGVANDEVLIFSPRGLVELYNIDIIIRSLAVLRDSGCKVKCMFSYAFGGEYLRRLENLIREFSLENNVIWLGCLGYHEMAEHYNAADIVVSVPISDSSPKSVYEAMFCKKPVIVSDLEWSYELLSVCECVLRVKVSDVLALANAIKYLIDNKNQGEKIASNAYEVAREHFDYYANMKKMEDIMAGVIDRKARQSQLSAVI